MDEIEKAVRTLAQLSEDRMVGVLSDEENEFVHTYDIAIPLAWLVEYGYAVATEQGNQNMLYVHKTYTAEFGDNNE